uniref:Protein FAR1-RELATED SEQUENCE n=1 Tax=Davidia involucrata TaxID=16924 RepID=A0A5B7AYW8_DAVIN
MDVDVIDVEEGNMGHDAVADDEDAEPNDGGEVNTAGNSTTRRVGFSTRVSQYNRSKSDGIVTALEFLCARDGLKKRAGDSCNAMLRIELRGQDKWVVTKFVKEHSHSTVSRSKVHYLRPRRHFAGATKNMDETCQGVGIVPSGVMYVSMDGNRVPVETNRGARNAPSVESNRTVKNTGSMSYAARPASRKRTLGKDAQNLLDYFKKMQAENPGFYYAIQLDDDNRMANVFWADARSRTAYSHFSDAVTLDTMYRVNHYRVPFAPFTGVNHHGQTVLFGCALLLDESEATFVWLFKTFLAAMNDCAPVSIITDQDKVIQAAVAQVFPEVRHCISKWHVLREGQERLAHVCHVHPNFQAELYNCINLTETIEEFESSWDSILDKYDLRRNDWLQSL